MKKLLKFLEVENEILIAISGDVRKIALAIIGAGLLGGLVEFDRISATEAGIILVSGIVLWLGAIITWQVALKLEKSKKKVSERFVHRNKKKR
ncbi:hypothetical protein [Motilimonas eburnea]|uniref:hypothetical protein n=1 Tax=Motilimonas eburnea TaxID=1737488 RepID=UPI001E2ED745|nr:hypothetical protein [Motilimonas eburnea]MCE2573858.1 hypothetical protein [Motilimonas eburnea]